MPKIKIDGKVCHAEQGELLSKILIREGFDVDHPCGGMGKCGKCTVIVNGKKELSCRYKVDGDCVVELQLPGEIQSDSGAVISSSASENMCFALDIGTTTVALVKVNLDNGSIISEKKCTNPQRRFGADIMSRIEYCTKNGTDEPKKAITDAVNKPADAEETAGEKIEDSHPGFPLHKLMHAEDSKEKADKKL